MAKLYFRYGAMNSGKSTNLLQVAHNYEERGMKVVILKPSTDTKGDQKIVSRLGHTRDVDLVLAKDQNVYDEMIRWRQEIGEIHCILVDEVQFLNGQQIDQLFELAVKEDIPTLCYGLRTDFLTHGFEGSQRLLLLAHTIEELKTICTCGKKAVFNGRKIGGQFVFTGDQVAIDHVDHVEYQSLCGKCYFQYRDKAHHSK